MAAKIAKIKIYPSGRVTTGKGSAMLMKAGATGASRFVQSVRLQDAEHKIVKDRATFYNGVGAYMDLEGATYGRAVELGLALLTKQDAPAQTSARVAADTNEEAASW
jgi:hypothetical protein